MITTISVTPTISAAVLYTTGDAVGGLLTFNEAVKAHEPMGIVRSVVIEDRDSEDVAMELHLFKATFTASANNAVFAPSDADLANYIGGIVIPAASYLNLSTNSIATVECNIPFKLDYGNNDLFGQLVARGGPTYTAVTDIRIQIAIES